MSGSTLKGAVLAGLLLPLAGLTWAISGNQETGFPHEWHEGLFPLCTGCHEGVPTDDVAEMYPRAEECAHCHDGDVMDPVAWSPPEPGTTGRNLLFNHADHALLLEVMGDEVPECAECHVPEGGGRMSVSGEIQLGTCFSCHAHEAEEHTADAECGLCHVPLAESGFARDRIAALPVPADHEAESFLLEGHGEGVEGNAERCATCHTVDRCLSCHVDGSREVFASIPAAPEGMELPETAAHYAEPATHMDEGWFSEHGSQASLASCGTCHAQNDCRACHVASVPDVVASLPTREQSRAPGVGLMARAPSSHDSYFFLDAHATLAAADAGTCQTCHEESFCVSCHDGPVGGGGYHPAGFVARHQAEAFGRDAECASCHNTQAFCRSCHVEAGVVSEGRVGAGYHAGEALWLIRHGQAARQNLESCASCHAQTDCTQCHSTLGAFKVNPHSRDFDAERAWDKNPRACLACHITNPLNGRQP